jgi:hypothetical protein
MKSRWLVWLSAPLGLLAVLEFAWGMQQAQAGDVFRWKDKQGNYHYSDKYTPDEAVHDRDKIDPTGVRADQYQEGAKSPEQLARERRLKELRKEQLRLLVEERDHDQALLRTYKAEEEMRATMESKLSTLDGIVKVTESNRSRQEDILDTQQKQAADVERRGQQVQKGLRDNIDATNRQIMAYRDKVRNLERDKANIKVTYERDVARFRWLTRQRDSESRSFFDWTEAASHFREEPIISAVSCQSKDICDRIWDLSRSYVRKVSNKPLVSDTPRLMHTEGPVGDDDIAAVVVRIVTKEGETLFFDTRCRNSSLGDELCASSRVDAIRNGYEPFIRSGLGLTAQ